MYRKQKELNSLLFPNWERKLLFDDFMTAIFVESGEAIDSLDWKWWKKQELDLENFKVELIDILHFMLSSVYYVGKENREKAFEAFTTSIKAPSEGFSKKRAIKLLKQLNCRDVIAGMGILGKLLKDSGITLEDLAKEYFTKAVLNKFRALNGYKDGTYQKIIKGKEDNVWVYELAKDRNLGVLEE
jgi:dimeric dUTPase (all-alpha-NTP-PPase superfamily)